MKGDKNKKSKLSIKSNKNKKQNKKNLIDKKKRISESFLKKNDENKEIKYKKRNWKKYLDETEDVKDKIIKKKNYDSNKEFNFIEKNENYILAEIYIEEKYINKDIRIINSFEEFKRYNGFFYDEENDYKYINEKEIKDNCIIKINNRKIKFKYFYKFKEKGKFNINYSFKKNIKNLFI